MSDEIRVTGPGTALEPREEDGGILADVAERKASRRQFIKGVIAAGAVASTSAYLFRGPGAAPHRVPAQQGLYRG